MARRPFDPRRVRTQQPERLFDGQTMLSPTQVHELVRGALARHLAPTLHVIGEIANLSRPSSGHAYFTLRDANSELRAVMWRSDAVKLKFALEEGLEVIASGGLDVYAPRGLYQLIVRRVEPRGAGALELAFRQMRDKLAREGLFDGDRKRPIPRLPRCIALVTSPHGAALRDILHTLRRRFPALDVCLFPTRVQGDTAAAEIAAAVRAANQATTPLGGIDTLIVARGGGSAEDLACFNSEAVARAIAASAIPTISAVGHETDITIADLVADLRAPTPTAAAELVAPLLEELLAGLARQLQRARRSLAAPLQFARQDLAALAARPWLANPASVVRAQAQRVDEAHSRLRVAWADRWRQARRELERCEVAVLRFGAGRTFHQIVGRIDTLATRVERALSATINRSQRRLTAAAGGIRRPDASLARYREAVRQATLRLAAAHPQQILKRGFSITRDARSGRLVSGVNEVREGLRLRIELADGEFFATGEDPRQPGLFD